MTRYALHINGSDPFAVRDKKVLSALNEAESAYDALESFAVANGLEFDVGNIESLSTAVLHYATVPLNHAPKVGSIYTIPDIAPEPVQQPDTGSLVVDFSNVEIHDLADRMCLHADLNPDVIQFGRYLTNHDHYVGEIRAHLVLEAGLQWLAEKAVKS